MTQAQRILRRLKNGETLNRQFCINIMNPGIMESPARICELRKQGYDIQTRMETIKREGQRAVTIAHWYLDGPEQGVLL